MNGSVSFAGSVGGAGMSPHASVTVGPPLVPVPEAILTLETEVIAARRMVESFAERLAPVLAPDLADPEERPCRATHSVPLAESIAELADVLHEVVRAGNTVLNRLGV